MSVARTEATGHCPLQQFPGIRGQLVSREKGVGTVEKPQDVRVLPGLDPNRASPA